MDGGFAFDSGSSPAGLDAGVSPRPDAGPAAPDAGVIGPDAGNPDAGPTQQIVVRVAHLSPGGPNLDLCVGVDGGSFLGPLLEQAGNTAGLGYEQVTAYLGVPADTTTARIVAANASDCTTPLLGAPDLPLPTGSALTIAAVGIVDAAGSGFSTTSFVDESASADAGSAIVRFVNATPGTPVDVGIESEDGAFTPLFANVNYPGIASGVNIDANGYLETAPLTNVTISIRNHAAPTDLIAAPGVSFAAGESATLFAVGNSNSTRMPVRALVCDDTAAPTNGFAACTVLPETISLRLANLSPGAAGMDFCLQEGSGSFQGPLLEAFGNTAGVAYAKVTDYLTFPGGQYTARLVAADATDCSASLGAPDVVLPHLADDALATLAAVGVAGAPTNGLTLLTFADEAEPTTADDAAARFVNASPGPALDVGIESGAQFTPLFTDVTYPNFASGSGIDANGYLSKSPVSHLVVTVRPHGSGTDELVIPNASFEAGGVISVFAIGIAGNATTPLQIVVCNDVELPTNGLSDCSTLPGNIDLRFAQLSPGAPPMDFCLENGNEGFTGPVLQGLGLDAGLSYAQVSGYLTLPNGSYEMRPVAGGATGCATSLDALPDTPLPVLPPAGIATVTALGVVGATTDGFALAGFADEQLPSVTGDAALRFLDASPGAPALDLGTEGRAGFTALFSDVAYSQLAIGMGIDTAGYLETAPLTDVVLGIRNHGSTTDAFTITGVSLSAGEVVSAFAIGVAGSSATPLQALVCDDTAPVFGGLTTCTVEGQ